MTGVRTMAALVTLTVCVHAQGPVCNGGAGLSLEVFGGRLGDGWSASLTGNAGEPGWLAVDTGPGPTLTGAGLVCLDLSPNLIAWPFQLDALGAAWFAGTLPPDPTLSGTTLALQAVATPPGGPPAFSAGRVARLRPPGFLVPSTNGVSFVDALTDAVSWTLPASLVLGTAWLRERDAFAVVRNTGAVDLVGGHDGSTIASVSLTPPNPTSFVVGLEPAENGRDLVIVWGPMAGTGPLSVDRIDLDLGAVLTSTSLGNVVMPPEIHTLPLPETPLLWLRHQGRMVCVNHLSGSIQSDQTLPGAITDWTLSDEGLFVLEGTNLWGFDELTGVGTPGNPLGIPIYDEPIALRFGPGAFGTALLVFFQGDAAGQNAGAIELQTSPIALQGFYSFPFRARIPEVAADGSGWVVLSQTTGLNPTIDALHWFDPATSSYWQVGSLSSTTEPRLLVLDSDSINRAYASEAGLGLRAFATAPAPTVGSLVPVAGITIDNGFVSGNR